MALDDNDNVCHWALGETLFRARQYDRALAHLRKALELNSNDADGLAASGYIQVAIGDPQLGLRQLNMALERNPSNPAWYRWMRGVSLTMLGRYDEALADFTSFGRLNPSVMRWRAYALAKLGRMDEARAQMQALLAARPDLTVGRMTKFLSCYPGCQDLIESLRQAGLPD